MTKKTFFEESFGSLLEYHVDYYTDSNEENLAFKITVVESGAVFNRIVVELHNGLETYGSYEDENGFEYKAVSPYGKEETFRFYSERAQKYLFSTYPSDKLMREMIDYYYTLKRQEKIESSHHSFFDHFHWRG